MLAECALDESRIHFTGHLARTDYLHLLQASDVHVYLTAPFVLSWSMLEAMSTGCALVASDVAPVAEFVTDGETGRLVPFHEPEAIAQAVAGLLDDRAAARAMGLRARAAIVADYDLDALLGAKRALLEQALARRRAEGAGR
jgi:hypothetical protein